MIEFLRDDGDALFVRINQEDISVEEFFDRRLGGLWESDLIENGKLARKYFLHAGRTPFGHNDYIELSEAEAITLSVETKRDIRRK
ncbi:MAG: hypothetical protein EOP83_18650 [Verrucomicrobiaceae bacterium]|nr:MAG: hypothetical protein EOP83_18650 [Verrucomicrobiaceae bacterium]